MDTKKKHKKTKVLFTMGAIPHYLTLLFNKLQKDFPIEVTVIKPTQKGQAVGSGVYETSQENIFQIIELPEYKTYYDKFFSKI